MSTRCAFHILSISLSISSIAFPVLSFASLFIYSFPLAVALVSRSPLIMPQSSFSLSPSFISLIISPIIPLTCSSAIVLVHIPLYTVCISCFAIHLSSFFCAIFVMFGYSVYHIFPNMCTMSSIVSCGTSISLFRFFSSSLVCGVICVSLICGSSFLSYFVLFFRTYIPLLYLFHCPCSVSLFAHLLSSSVKFCLTCAANS